MKNDDLLKRVSELGFPLLVAESDKNANLTLADMVKNADTRLWEGFPVVLANSAENGLLSYEKVAYYLKQPLLKRRFESLAAMSLALYNFYSLKFAWAGDLLGSFTDRGKKEFDGFLKKLKNDETFLCGGREMSSQRLKTVFNNYFKQAQARLERLVGVKEELGLEFALAQVFSPKQRELFYKKLRREKLTKTEKEYFSRAVKKKVLALANPELHRLAQRLLQE